MPRTADHAARRAQIIGGVRAVALAEGLGNVTVAGTAKAAGVSTGLVQHYYASKEALLLDTFSAVRAGVIARVEAATERAEKRSARIEHMLTDGLLQLLPLDRRRREEGYLVHAFAGLALDDTSLADHVRAVDAELVGRVVTALQNGKACGEVEPATDSAARGNEVFALVTGLAARLHVSSTPDERRWAREAVARQARELCPGPCSRARPAPAVTQP